MVRNSIVLLLSFLLSTCAARISFGQVILINDFNCIDEGQTEQKWCSNFFPEPNGVACPVSCQQFLGIWLCHINGWPQFSGYTPPAVGYAWEYTEGTDTAVAETGQFECAKRFGCSCKLESNAYVCVKGQDDAGHWLRSIFPTDLECPVY